MLQSKYLIYVKLQIHFSEINTFINSFNKSGLMSLLKILKHEIRLNLHNIKNDELVARTIAVASF